jgi:hypothetical protein
MNTFVEPTEELRTSNEYVETLWRCARGLCSQQRGLGLEEAYEILEQVRPRVKIENGRVKKIQFFKRKLEGLIQSHIALRW